MVKKSALKHKHKEYISRMDDSALTAFVVTILAAAALFLALLIAHSLFDAQRGVVATIIAAWLVALAPSLVIFIAGLIQFPRKNEKKGRGVRVSHRSEWPLTAIIIGGSLATIWVIVCTWLIAKHILITPFAYWMALLLPIGIVGFIGTYVLILWDRMSISVIDRLLAFLMGALASGGLMYISANIFLVLGVGLSQL